MKSDDKYDTQLNAQLGFVVWLLALGWIANIALLAWQLWQF